jgi:8-oxo-dGTP pyrophosphatase MutT (NUDIX family)
MRARLQIVYRGEAPPHAWERALFLAGPADPAPGAPSWQQAALARLRSKGYSGVVFVDEDRRAAKPPTATARGRWAGYWRRRADCVVLWLPAAAGAATLELARLGEWAGSGRIVLGVADDAVDGAAELRRWASARRVPVAQGLPATVDHALDLLPPGARREDAEREVPLLIWNTSWFQGWYSAQKGAGNKLVEVKGVWTFRVGPGRRRVTFWALNPRIWIAAEKRSMSTEVVIGRTDMSALMLYRPGARLEDTEVVLVRDFRPAARTPDGYVCELPSGSGDAEDPQLVALFELAEETGLDVDSGRLRYHGAQQVWATGAAHVVHLYSVVASRAEIDYVRAEQRAGTAHGLHEQEEYTFPQVQTWQQILASPSIDWATRGMIAQVLVGPGTA